MANSNPAGHPSKPSKVSRTKATAPRDINLDKVEENIIPEWTRTDRPRSTKQAQMGKWSHMSISGL